MAWLYVPGLEGSNSGSTSPSDTKDFAPFVTSSGTPTRRPLSWRGWATRPWISLLSGTTYSRSTLDRGAERWISSLPDSPANHFPSPESGEPNPTSDTSSPESLRSFATWDRASSSWKTCEGCLPLAGGESLGTYSEPWPTSGSIRSGSACEQAPWVPPTVESGFSFSEFPTPTATSYGSNQGGSAGRTGKVRPSLETLAKTWPTPTAGDSLGAGSRNLEGSKAHAGVSLTDMALFGNSNTPRRPSPPDPKTETPGRESSPKGPTSLPLWPTANANDWKGTARLGQRRGQLDEAAEQKWSSGKAKLNPNFVEWLMGFPPGWTLAEKNASGRAEMASFLFRQRSLLSSLLGERG